MFIVEDDNGANGWQIGWIFDRFTPVKTENLPTKTRADEKLKITIEITLLDECL